MPKNIGVATKQKVAKRANHCCEYCFSQVDYCPDPFSIKHITPAVKGGTNEVENLAYSCQGCNNRKYDFTSAIDPITGTKVSIYQPRNDDWETHFKWSEDFIILIGITPVGRATIDRLQLNRRGVVNLRKVMVMAKKHPPF